MVVDLQGNVVLVLESLAYHNQHWRKYSLDVFFIERAE
jgi:hypothetical protein